MEEVLIVTLFDVQNYGNRLQNYASQHVLNQFNFNTKTVTYRKNLKFANRAKNRLKSFIKIVLMKYYSLANKQPSFMYNPLYKFSKYRKCSFKYFNNHYINAHEFKSILNLPNFKYYVIGSDQVWNPSWYGEFKDQEKLFLLGFAKPEQKVCFSPSFGIDKIPNEWKEFFAKELKTFPKISVREKSGTKIVKDLTGKDAEVLIDPTLMLNKEEWLNVSKKPQNVDTDSGYLLVYFLGKKTERVKQDIAKFSKQYNLKVLDFFDEDQPEMYVCGPSEFVYLFSKTKLVLTDSFHGSVFSFLFNKPFFVYGREDSNADMSSRITTLTDTFSLQRKYVNAQNNDIYKDPLECDYSVGYKQLELERKKVIKFLKESMNLD